MTTATETGFPVLLGLREMADLFPVAKQTVYRWRVRRQGSSSEALPPPFLIVSGTPMWTEETVLAFGAERGLVANKQVLARIRREQKARRN